LWAVPIGAFRLRGERLDIASLQEALRVEVAIRGGEDMSERICCFLSAFAFHFFADYLRN
jgi:hypothetical protein